MKYMRLWHTLLRAQWNEAQGKWHLRLRRPRFPEGAGDASKTSTTVEDDYEEFDDTADVLFLGTGSVTRWHWPQIDGLESFKGKLVHSAQWDISNSTDGGWEEG